MYVPYPSLQQFRDKAEPPGIHRDHNQEENVNHQHDGHQQK